MTWFKVDDHLHSHRKAMRAGTEAMGLWVLAGSWSAAEESDGWVPAYVLTRLAGPGCEQLAEQLVAAGLWHADEHEGEDGYRFHAWDEYQPAKADLDKRRELQRERMRRVRGQGGDVRAHSASSEPAVTPTPTRPDPTKDKTPSRKRDEVPDSFDAFWSEYPAKVGKAAAAKAYAKALRETDHETVMAGLANSVQVWRAENRERRYLPHPATWLNQGRWADEVPLPDMPGSTTGRPAVTLNQCDGTDCQPGKHEWADSSNRYVCMGTDA